MKAKEKLLLTLLFVMFLTTITMFFYQNVYNKSENESNKVTVLIAKKDIAKGTEINKDNVGMIKLDKNVVFSNYVTQVDFEKIDGKMVTSDIFVNEIINVNKIINEEINNNQFTIKIEPNYYSDVEQLDNVRVYVQIFDKKTKETSLYEILDKKQIADVNYKKDTKGNITGILSIELNVSDEEALNYYNAKKLGEILVLKFNSLTEDNKLSVPQFRIDSPEIIRLTENNILEEDDQFSDDDKVENKKEETTIIYNAKEKDTFAYIAKMFNVTIDDLKKDNPEIEEVSDGDIVQITIR